MRKSVEGLNRKDRLNLSSDDDSLTLDFSIQNFVGSLLLEEFREKRGARDGSVGQGSGGQIMRNATEVLSKTTGINATKGVGRGKSGNGAWG